MVRHDSLCRSGGVWVGAEGWRGGGGGGGMIGVTMPHFMLLIVCMGSFTPVLL